MADDPLIWQLVLQLILIAVNAVFACAEIAVISINDTKLERMAQGGDLRAKRLFSLTAQPAKFFATIQVGITLAGFLGSAFAADNFADRIVAWAITLGTSVPLTTLRAIAVVIITIILSYFTLILGELVPKRVAMQNAEALGLKMSGLIWVVSKLFAPLVFVLTTSTNALLRLMRIDPNANEEHVTEEEIRMMVDVGSEKGAIDLDEKEFINNLFEFDNTTADEIMTHRTELTLLWLEEDDGKWAETIQRTRFSYYPVCADTPDDIVGVLSAKEYFRLSDQSREKVMRESVRPAQFVPESVRADVLFRKMQSNRNHFSLVLDEHGGLSGAVTMNDLLEELVGDLDDTLDAPAEVPEIEKIDESTWRVTGSAPLDDLSDAIGVKLPEDEYDMFASMVFGLLGEVPDDGSKPQVEAFGLAIQVTDIREHRLESALVTKAE